jgi:adenylate cyclase
MSLRLRTLLILTLSIAIGTGFAAYIARVWLVDGFRSLEEQDAIRNMGRFRAALNQALEDMDRSTGDYSYWDDTYSFMQHQTKAYINTNYGSDTLNTNHWDAVLLVDDQGGVVFSVGLDRQTNDVAAVPDYILSLARNFRNDWRPTSGEGVFKGFIQTSDGPYMMAVRRILPSSRKGEGRGNVVTFRRLAGSEFERIAQLTRLNASLTAVNPDASLGAMGSKIEYPNEDDLIVKGNFDDVSKTPAFGVAINISRDIAKQGQKSIQMVLWGTFVIGCLILLSVILMIEKAILSRLSKLSSDVRHVTASADFHDRVGEFGDDELGQLGHDINDTLVSHEKMHDELVRERERA